MRQYWQNKKLIIGVFLILLYLVLNSSRDFILNFKDKKVFRDPTQQSIVNESILNSKHISCKKNSNYNYSIKNCNTIVTSYFYASKSKHNPSNYKEWMSNFLSRIDTPMVIFTQPSFVSYILSLRAGRPTHLIVYNEIWDIDWIKDRGLKNTYFKMHDIDPERSIHSPDLYAIWNSKVWMLNHVSEKENVFNSTFFYWMDIGSVRAASNKMEIFPDVDKVIINFGENKKEENYKKFNLFAVSHFLGFKQFPQSNTFDEMDTIFVIGGFFGGTLFGINWFSKAFYEIHDHYMKKGYFVGKDQTIYNFLATQYSDNILVVCSCLEKNEECGDSWFYFQKWYSSFANGAKCQTSPLISMTEFLLTTKKQITDKK